MSTRCIIRNLLLASASLAIVVWPSISQATQLYPTVNVLTWTDSTTGLNLGATGSLNLVNNALVIQASDPTAALAAYTYVWSEIQDGANGSPGAFQAGTPGIVSDSTPFNTPSLTYPSAFTDSQIGYGITGIGADINDGSLANPYSGNDPSWTVWNGVAVNANSVLVGFTYLGDTDMSGAVYPYDITNAVASYLYTPTQAGWANGESDYTGVIDPSDISNVVAAYLYQADDPIVDPTQPDAAAAAFGSPLSVPEPATIWMGLLGVVVLLASFGGRLCRQNRNCRPMVSFCAEGVS